MMSTYLALILAALLLGHVHIQLFTVSASLNVTPFLPCAIRKSHDRSLHHIAAFAVRKNLQM